MNSPKTQTKFLIHPQLTAKTASQPHANNIFTDDGNAKAALENFTLYSIVGDPTFKLKYYRQKSPPSTLNETKHSTQTLDETALNTTYCQYTRDLQNKTLTCKLPGYKKIEITHDERTFGQARKYRNRDKLIQKHIRMRSNKTMCPSTVTFGSIQQIYAHPNPEKMDLINDNIPEYWKNSLRDNEKRLKRHLKGNSFRKQVAEEMLQTLKGRKLIEATIPKIKEQYKTIPCSRTLDKEDRNKRKKGFSLVGRPAPVSLSKDQQSVASKTSINFPNLMHDEVYTYQYDAGRKWKAYEI